MIFAKLLQSPFLDHFYWKCVQSMEWHRLSLRWAFIISWKVSSCEKEVSASLLAHSVSMLSMFAVCGWSTIVDLLASNDRMCGKVWMQWLSIYLWLFRCALNSYHVPFRRKWIFKCFRCDNVIVCIIIIAFGGSVRRCGDADRNSVGQMHCFANALHLHINLCMLSMPMRHYHIHIRGDVFAALLLLLPEPLSSPPLSLLTKPFRM